MSSDVRRVFLDAAAATSALVAHPAVGAAWDAPSALDRMTVGELAAHVARAGVLVRVYLDASPDDSGASGEVDAVGYYLSFGELADVESDLSRGVRQRARDGAAAGHAAVVDAMRAAVADLRSALPALPRARSITVRDGIVLPLDEYLRTRIIELVVHGDDLCASVPELAVEAPHEARDVAVEVLVGLAVRRHGSLALVRALTRRERDDVQALRVF